MTPDAQLILAAAVVAAVAITAALIAMWRALR